MSAKFRVKTLTYGSANVPERGSMFWSTIERNELAGIPVAPLILDNWEYASWRVMSGSTPEAESFLGWKKIDVVNCWAMRFEPT
jgi:hypothetical protein